MSRQLTLPTKKTLTIIPQQSVTLETDKISIDLVIDDGVSVVANISFFNPTGQTKTLTLWAGDGYISIGQWTDSQVDAQVKLLLGI